MAAPLRLTDAQRAALVRVGQPGGATTREVMIALPRGFYSVTTENRTYKILARLAKRGLVEQHGAGSSSVWILTLTGRSAIS